MVLVFNDSWDILREIVQAYSGVDGFVQTPVTGYLAKEIDSLDAVKGGSIDRARVTDAIASGRASISQYLGSIANQLTGAILLIGESIGSPSTDPLQILLDLRDYFDDNGETIASREFVFGAQVAVGVPNGDGLIARCTEDAFGNDIERVHADVITFLCLRDQTVGGTDPGKEIFRISGRRTGPDELEIDNTDRGSGLDEEVAGQEAIDSIVPNASFNSADSDAAPVTLTGWGFDNAGTIDPTFLGTGADIQIDRSNIYRASKSLEGTNPGSLQVRKAIRLVAALGADGRGGLDERFPYFGGIAANGVLGTFIGRLTVRIGTMQFQQTFTGVETWALKEFPRTAGSNWPENLSEIPPDEFFEIEVDNYTSGYITLDHFLFHPMPSYDGHFVSLVGRAIDWKKKDKYTLTDTHSATPGEIQTALWRGFGLDLPHLPASNPPTRPD